jgi:putative aldouronate transport system permease protein
VFSTFAFETIFKSPEKIMRAYMVTISLAVFGTAISLFVTSMTAYVLNRKDFVYSKRFAFFLYFTTLFNGGIITYYILMVRYLQLKNSLIALFIPHLLNVFYILVMRNFMKSIPDSIMESGKIDGADDFKIYSRLVLPLLGPALAAIGLFIALSYWNDWSNAMLYIDNAKLYPLQYLLYRMVSSINFAANVTASSGVALPDMPQQSIKMAMTVVAIGPIILLYPFLQKYFVKGITLGSVKG